MSETPTEPKHYFRCKACNPSLTCWDTGARCKHPEAIEHAPLPSTPPPEAAGETPRMVPMNYPWLEMAHFLPTNGETMLLAWVRGDHVTYRTGRYLGGKFVGTSRDEFRTQPNYYREVTGLFNLPDEGDKLRAENLALTSKLAELTKELAEARLPPVAMKLVEAQMGAPQTYEPVQGMIICTHATGNYVLRSDYEALKTLAPRITQPYPIGNLATFFLRRLAERDESMADLAKRWGKSRQYVSKLLNANDDSTWTIKTVQDLFKLTETTYSITVSHQ